VDKWAVILFIAMPTLLYAPMNFAAAWFYAHFKIHHVLKSAALLQLLGGWIRALSFIGDPGNFWLLMMG